MLNTARCVPEGTDTSPNKRPRIILVTMQNIPPRLRNVGAP